MQSVVPVANLRRSVAFYQDLLGFHIRPSASAREAQLEHSDSMITLRETNDRKLIKALLHLAIEVDSVARATTYLEERGVLVRRTSACADVASQVCITDPDGHVLILFEIEARR